MTSLTFDLGETEHRLQSTKIKLQTRSRLHIILPDSSEHYRSLHEFVEAGFWITRGNDLKLRVRTDHDACTGVGVGSSTLEEATSRAISEAKVLFARLKDASPHNADSDYRCSGGLNSRLEQFESNSNLSKVYSAVRSTSLLLSQP